KNRAWSCTERTTSVERTQRFQQPSTRFETKYISRRIASVTSFSSAPLPLASKRGSGTEFGSGERIDVPVRSLTRTTLPIDKEAPFIAAPLLLLMKSVSAQLP